MELQQHQSFSSCRNLASKAAVRKFPSHVFRFFLEAEATGAKVSIGAEATLLMKPGILTLLVSIGMGPDLCGI